MTDPAGGPDRPVVRDPWKGLRGVFAITLVLESVVVALSLTVVAKSGDAGPVGIAVVLALAVGMALGSGLQRRPWGLPFALALQVAMIACVFVLPALGVLGVLFGLIWIYFLRLRRDVARRMAAGQLPDQLR